MSTQTQDSIGAMVERWIRHELPLINRGMDAHGDIHFLLDRCALPVEAIAHAASDVWDPRMALSLLQLLAFPVSSVERHFQMAGNAPGDGVTALRAAYTLLRLGEVAMHPPRDSQYTLWMRNSSDMPLMFIASSFESMMIRVVRESQHLYEISTAALRPMCNGDVNMTSATAIDAMEFAAGNCDRITALAHGFLAPSIRECTSPAMQFASMATSLSTYFVDYPVGVQTFPAPSLAALLGQTELNLAIGLKDDMNVEAMRRDFVPCLLAEDRTRLERALEQTSIAARLAEAAGLTENDLVKMSDADVTHHLSTKSWLLRALRAFARLSASADTSAAYMTLMKNCLRREPSSVPHEIGRMKTLVQTDDSYKTLPQSLSRPSNSAAYRLAAVAAI